MTENKAAAFVALAEVQSKLKAWCKKNSAKQF